VKAIIEFETKKVVVIEGNLVRESSGDGFFLLSYLAFADSDKDLAQALVDRKVASIYVDRDEQEKELIYLRSDALEDHFLGLITKVDRKVTKFTHKDNHREKPKFWGN